MALGARPRDGAGLVIRQSVQVVILGIGIGIACALALTRFLESLLYEVSPNDPSTIAGVSGVLLGVALLASWLPAHQATRTDPMGSAPDRVTLLRQCLADDHPSQSSRRGALSGDAPSSRHQPICAARRGARMEDVTLGYSSRDS